jgi:hypothetical protein
LRSTAREHACLSCQDGAERHGHQRPACRPQRSFPDRLAQIEKYLGTTDFNNFNLQAAKPSDTLTSSATVKFGSFNYSTKQLTSNANLSKALPGLSASDSFTIGIKKGGVTTNVQIDLAQVPGTLSLGNVISYINGQLSAAGFSTRFQKTQTGGTATSSTNATYGMQVTPGGVEQVSFSAASTPSLYLVGSSGLATETRTTTNTATSAVTATPPDQAARLTKISGINGTPSSTFSVNQKATNGITPPKRPRWMPTATSMSSAPRPAISTASSIRPPGRLSHQIRLRPAMWRGRIFWAAAAPPMATAWRWIRRGGVVGHRRIHSRPDPTSVADGNNDSFVARYDSSGNQTWIKQIPTLATEPVQRRQRRCQRQYLYRRQCFRRQWWARPGGPGQGRCVPGQIRFQRQAAAENQFGTSGNDSVAATATDAAGNLFVASVQNWPRLPGKYRRRHHHRAGLDPGSGRPGGGRQHRRLGRRQWQSLCSRARQQWQSGGPAWPRRPAGGIDAFVISATDNGASSTPHRHLYRHLRHRQRR